MSITANREILAPGEWRAEIVDPSDDSRLLAQLPFPIFPSNSSTDDALTDQLVSRFYEIRAACTVTGEMETIVPCSSSSWSTQFPDPKSEIIRGFDYDNHMLR